MTARPSRRTYHAAVPLAVVLVTLVATPTRSAVAVPLVYGGRNVELSVTQVSDRTVRVTLTATPSPRDGVSPNDSAVLAPQRWPEPALRASDLEGPRDVVLGPLRVRVTPVPLACELSAAEGRPVQRLEFGRHDDVVTFRLGEGPLLGLGEGAQQFDRRGALYPMQPSWGGWNRAVLGSVVPSPYLIGTSGWALFAHRPEGQFDLRGDVGRFLPAPDALARGGLDVFLVHLAEPADAPREYARITGRAAMPPKWALGYFQSHRTLGGPDEPLRVARTFRDKKLPCDALIYLGTGYCPAGWNTGHGSLEFNPRTFERPRETIDALHGMNFHVVLHVNRAPRDLFGRSVEAPSDSPRHIRNYWARHRRTFETGVDGWWPDDGDELPLAARLARHRIYYEGPLLDRPGVRPWSLHRTGYAGSQRFGGWVWSGDIDGTWATLAAQVSVGLNHSLSLTPFWGTDTGGFYPTHELTGELYARWFQFSTFCPSFRSHGRTWKLRLPWGWNTGEFGPVEHPTGPDRSELTNAEVEPICRKYLELRYRLLPYNYTLVREACDTGLPPMRAMWLHYASDAEAAKLGTQFLWGPDLLVAPVVERGAKVRRVYLPAGTWYDWWTGEATPGGRWVEKPVDMATLPLYVRAGAIVPLDPVRQYTAQPADGPTLLRVYPGAAGQFTLYDDDGASLRYRDGSDDQTVWLHMRWDDAGRRLRIEADERMKKWPGGVRAFQVERIGAAAGTASRRVEFRGEAVDVEL